MWDAESGLGPLAAAGRFPLHSFAQTLQKEVASGVSSSIDSSSQPHFGQRDIVGVGSSAFAPSASAANPPDATAFPVSCLSPLTYISPRRTCPSGCTRHS